MITTLQGLFVSVRRNFKLNWLWFYKPFGDSVSAAALLQTKLGQRIFTLGKLQVGSSIGCSRLVADAECSVSVYMGGVCFAGFLIRDAEIVVFRGASVIRGFDDFKRNAENIGVIAFRYNRLILCSGTGAE